MKHLQHWRPFPHFFLSLTLISCMLLLFTSIFSNSSIVYLVSLGLTFLCLSIYLSIYLTIYLFVCPSIYLSTYLHLLLLRHSRIQCKNANSTLFCSHPFQVAEQAILFQGQMIWSQQHHCVPPWASSLLGRCSLIHPWVLTEEKALGCKSELCQELIIPSISEYKHNLNAVLLWEPVCCWPVCPSEDCEHRNVIIYCCEALFSTWSYLYLCKWELLSYHLFCLSAASHLHKDVSLSLFLLVTGARFAIYLFLHIMLRQVTLLVLWALFKITFYTSVNL